MPLDLDPGKWEEVEGGEVVCLQLSIYLILGPIILCKPTIGSGRHHHHPDQKLFLHELKNFGLVVYTFVVDFTVVEKVQLYRGSTVSQPECFLSYRL